MARYELSDKQMTDLSRFLNKVPLKGAEVGDFLGVIGALKPIPPLPPKPPTAKPKAANKTKKK